MGIHRSLCLPSFVPSLPSDSIPLSASVQRVTRSLLAWCTQCTLSRAYCRSCINSLLSVSSVKPHCIAKLFRLYIIEQSPASCIDWSCVSTRLAIREGATMRRSGESASVSASRLDASANGLGPPMATSAIPQHHDRAAANGFNG